MVVFGTVAALASGRIVYKYLKKRRRREAEDLMKKQLAAGRRERRAHTRDKNLSEV
ncbi:jg23110, partial [Pararge aegeria aegeria]